MLRFDNKRCNNSNSTYLPDKFIFFYTSMDALPAIDIYVSGRRSFKLLKRRGIPACS